MQYRGLELDAFQEQAIEHLRQGRSVLVSAPTGTGKTIIADWIVDEALKSGRRVIYTAPIKALSNQKFRDYTRLHGEEAVGLVTGDLVIRRDAPCRVMTTEILRNMLLTGEELVDLVAVVIDEIHFLDDPERGTVWEEVLIYLPPEVQIVGLSATLSNLTEFASWLEHVRGQPIGVVTEERRAVPLHFRFASVDTGIVERAEYERIWRRKRGALAAPALRGGRGRAVRGQRGGRPGGGAAAARARRTSPGDLFDLVAEQELLPCLYFTFSRRDTEAYARRLVRWVGDSLLTEDAQARMDARLAAAREELGGVLDRELFEAYSRGIAFHHAGLHVQLKALVEELYEARLLMVLFCTSTFALGLNMPARSVVFDGLKKFDGRAVAPLTTRGFMQKAGRAGRRGMDDEGHVVIRMDLEEWEELKPVVERYARGAYEPVHSSFNLSWNSVVNLLERYDEDQIRELVDKSFLSWHLNRLARQSLERAAALEQEADRAEGPASRQQRKEARRLRSRAGRSDDRVWVEFQRKVRFLQAIGYLDADLGFNAGAKVLRSLYISEILVTELVLSGALEELDPPTLFGVCCTLTNDLPRNTTRHFVLRKDDRRLIREIEEVRSSPAVREAEDIAELPYTFSPELLPLGRAWAEGQPLTEILLMVHSPADISGDLVTGFRRAKDLLGQLKDVYLDLPDRAAMLSRLIRAVSRDEVEVVD